MTNPSKVHVNVALTLRNTGPTTAQSFHAVARVRRGEGVSLALRDPRNPGDASAHQEDDDDVIEWQSTEPWPSGHTRRIQCTLHLRQGARVPIAVTLRAPHMKPVQREVVVTWPASEPVIQVVV